MAEWSDLRHFLEVHRSGTLSGAARALGVNQTTVGRRLAVLEQALGARLFDRTPDGFVLTTAGERILGAVEKVEEASLLVERQAGGEDARLEGNVRVATSEAFATGFLLDRLGEFSELHPGITLELAVGQPSVDLSRREADLAVRFRYGGMAPAQPNLLAKKLGRMAFALYGSTSHLERHGTPRRADDLAGRRVLVYDDDLPAIPGVAWLREHGAAARVIARCGSILALFSAARGGAGLAVLPCFLGARESSLRRIEPPTTLDWADMWLVVHPDLRSVARIRAVMDWIVATTEQAAAAFTGVTPRSGRRRG